MTTGASAALLQRSRLVHCDHQKQVLKCVLLAKGAFRRPSPGFWRPQAPETGILKIHDSKTRGKPYETFEKFEKARKFELSNPRKNREKMKEKLPFGPFI